MSHSTARERPASDRLERSASSVTGQRCAARPAPLDGELPPSVSRRSFFGRRQSRPPSLDPIYPLGPNRQVPTRNNHVCALTTSDGSAAEESLSISSMRTVLLACRNQFDST